MKENENGQLARKNKVRQKIKKKKYIYFVDYENTRALYENKANYGESEKIKII